MNTFVVDVSNVAADIENFPNGPVEAEVLSAEWKTNDRSGASYLNIMYDIYHPNVGTARFWDSLYTTFPPKAKALFVAINDFSPEQAANLSEIELVPEELPGERVILFLDDWYNEKTQKTRKTVGRPYYLPISRQEVLVSQGG